MATDEREWKLHVSMTGSRGWGGPAISTCGFEEVVPRARAEAAEHRVLDLTEKLSRLEEAMRGQGLLLARAEQRVRELEKDHAGTIEALNRRNDQLYAAEQRIEELEGQLTGALDAEGLRDRWLSAAREERDWLRGREKGRAMLERALAEIEEGADAPQD